MSVVVLGTRRSRGTSRGARAGGVSAVVEVLRGGRGHSRGPWGRCRRSGCRRRGGRGGSSGGRGHRGALTQREVLQCPSGACYFRCQHRLRLGGLLFDLGALHLLLSQLVSALFLFLLLRLLHWFLRLLGDLIELTKAAGVSGVQGAPSGWVHPGRQTQNLNQHISPLYLTPYNILSLYAHHVVLKKTLSNNPSFKENFDLKRMLGLMRNQFGGNPISFAYYLHMQMRKVKF